MKTTTRPRPRRDPVVAALRRLIRAAERTTTSATELREARAELARLLDEKR